MRRKTILLAATFLLAAAPAYAAQRTECTSFLFGLFSSCQTYDARQPAAKNRAAAAKKPECHVSLFRSCEYAPERGGGRSGGGSKEANRSGGGSPSGNAGGAGPAGPSGSPGAQGPTGPQGPSGGGNDHGGCKGKCGGGNDHHGHHDDGGGKDHGHHGGKDRDRHDHGKGHDRGDHDGGKGKGGRH